MFEHLMQFFKKFNKKDEKVMANNNSKEAAKERLHLVLMQDRANVSSDFLEIMKQEIIDVIKKYIDIDEGAIDVRLTNKENEDGTNGAPALYANIPIVNIKNDIRKNNLNEAAKMETNEDEKVVQEDKKRENNDIEDEKEDKKEEKSKEIKKTRTKAKTTEKKTTEKKTAKRKVESEEANDKTVKSNKE